MKCAVYIANIEFHSFVGDALQHATLVVPTAMIGDRNFWLRSPPRACFRVQAESFRGGIFERPAFGFHRRNVPGSDMHVTKQISAFIQQCA